MENYELQCVSTDQEAEEKVAKSSGFENFLFAKTSFLQKADQCMGMLLIGHTISIFRVSAGGIRLSFRTGKWMDVRMRCVR
jgi:hypothetical protein